MSSASPAPDSGEESTALFAELDALLERMLALPVSYREEPERSGDTGTPPPQELPPLITIAEAMPEPVVTYTTPPPPVTIVDERLVPRSTLDFAAAGPAAESAPVLKPEAPARDPLAGASGFNVGPLAGASGSNAESADFHQKPAATEEAAAAADTVVAPESLTSSFEPPPPLWLWPLLWVNRGFDRCTAPLGAPGRWLRGSAGKGLLGWTGLLLLAIAGGIALHDWFGWTW